MSAVFVTGTDTGVGKTFVSCALLHAARARGWSARGIKAVESGCQSGPEGLIAADACALAEAAGHLPSCGARFEAAASPARAAELAGTSLSLPDVAGFVTDQIGAGFTVVEGAGGLLAPLTGLATMAELAVLLELPVVIVGRDALGTVNHTLLTIEAARARSLEVKAVVFSGQPGASAALEDSARQVERASGLKVWRLPAGSPAETHPALDGLLALLAGAASAPPG